MNKGCHTCKNNLGGGCCKLNSERECMDDDNHPLWEARKVFRDYVDLSDYKDALEPKSIHATTAGNKVEATFG